MNDEMKIDLIKIFHEIISIRKILYRAIIIGVLIGIIVALSIPRKYTVTVALSPEMGFFVIRYSFFYSIFTRTFIYASSLF